MTNDDIRLTSKMQQCDKTQDSILKLGMTVFFFLVQVAQLQLLVSMLGKCTRTCTCMLTQSCTRTCKYTLMLAMSLVCFAPDAAAGHSERIPAAVLAAV